MQTTLYATFAKAEDGIRAVESLLHHGVHAKDVKLLFPSSQYADVKQPAMASQAANSASRPLSSLIGYCHEAVLDTEQGAGLGLGIGLLMALCIPGIGMIAGSELIVVGLIAAGTAIGSIAGGIYGYLLDRGVDHEVARMVSDHAITGSVTVSVKSSGGLKTPEIVCILEGHGGCLMPHFQAV